MNQNLDIIKREHQNLVKTELKKWEEDIEIFLLGLPIIIFMAIFFFYIILIS